MGRTNYRAEVRMPEFYLVEVLQPDELGDALSTPKVLRNRFSGHVRTLIGLDSNCAIHNYGHCTQRHEHVPTLELLGLTSAITNSKCISKWDDQGTNFGFSVISFSISYNGHLSLCRIMYFTAKCWHIIAPLTWIKATQTLLAFSATSRLSNNQISNFIGTW